MRFQYNDGGRQACGFEPNAGDCVVRAIAIATERPYLLTYSELLLWSLKEPIRRSTPEKGVYHTVYEPYLKSLGWIWTPTTFVGHGCITRMREDHLPPGRIIVQMAAHMSAVIDHVINDTYDPSFNGTRFVYGYFSRGNNQ